MSECLVKVTKIDAILPHSNPNVDRMEIAVIEGWRCIVEKNMYKKGDTIVFVPPDYCIPGVLSDKLGITKYLRRGGRVQSIKLKEEVSHGVIMPMDVLPQDLYGPGDNIAHILGITKYVPLGKPSGACLPSTVRKRRTFSWQVIKRFWQHCTRPWWFKVYRILSSPYNPFNFLNKIGFTQYTDIQNLRQDSTFFEPDEEIVAQEKVDGTNFRAGYIGGMYCVGSHHCNLERDPKNLYWRAAEKYILKDLLWNLSQKGKKNVVIFGEIYGTGIPSSGKGLYYTKSWDVVFFDIYIDGQWLDYGTLVYVLNKVNLPQPPVLYEGKFSELDFSCVEGKSILAKGNHITEGMVIRSINGQRRIKKYLSDNYLCLKYKKE